MKILFLLILIAISPFLYSQEDFFYGIEKETYFTKIDNDKIYIRFREGTSEYQKDEILSENNLENTILADRFNSSDYLIAYLMGANIKERSRELLKNNEVIYVSGFYRIENSTDDFCFTGTIAVRLKATTNLEVFNEVISQENLEIRRQSRFRDGVYYLEPTIKGINVVPIANSLFKTGLFYYSSPDLIFQYKR